MAGEIGAHEVEREVTGREATEQQDRLAVAPVSWRHSETRSVSTMLPQSGVERPANGSNSGTGVVDVARRRPGAVGHLPQRGEGLHGVALGEGGAQLLAVLREDLLDRLVALRRSLSARPSLSSKGEEIASAMSHHLPVALGSLHGALVDQALGLQLEARQ